MCMHYKLKLLFVSTFYYLFQHFIIYLITSLEYFISYIIKQRIDFMTFYL